MHSKLDQLLAFHCAPTLSGLKPANLITHEATESFYSSPNANLMVETLKKKDICIEKICSCSTRELTLVYHESRLWAHLQQPQIWGFLVSQGYPMSGDLPSILEALKRRVTESGGFPHEIGVFLGYPLEDVIGFIRNKGQNSKMCGYWKVYGDTHSAIKQFDQFTKCRDLMINKLIQGMSITQLLNVS
jgi:hypothetical protein